MVRTNAVFTAAERMSPEIAVRLAQLAEKFDANLLIECGTTSIQLDSLIGVLSLQLYKGKALTVVADGSDESEAAKAIADALAGE